MKKSTIFTIVGIVIAIVLFIFGCKIVDINDQSDMGIKSVQFVLDNSDTLIGKEVMIKGYIAYINNSGATFTGQKMTDISLVNSPSDISENGERPSYDKCVELLIFSEEKTNLKIGDEIVVLCSVHCNDEIGVFFDFIEFAEYE